MLEELSSCGCPRMFQRRPDLAPSANLSADLGKEIPVEISSYDRIFDRSVQRDRMLALLSGLFGLLGVTLACMGLYGVLSNAVSDRAR